MCIRDRVRDTLPIPPITATSIKIRKEKKVPLSTVKTVSYTHLDVYKRQVYDIIVSKEFLGEGDKVLVIDDFLANGKALEGLTALIKDSGAELSGAGIVIEKGFQDGGKRIREKGIRLESLAIVDSMDDETGEIVFRNE